MGRMVVNMHRSSRFTFNPGRPQDTTTTTTTTFTTTTTLLDPNLCRVSLRIADEAGVAALQLEVDYSALSGSFLGDGRA